MAVFRKEGKDNLTSTFLKKASTAISANSVLSVEPTTGLLIPATATTNNVKGISRAKIASTDTDYTTAREILIDVPRPSEIFEMDCNTTITQAMVGDLFDLADANTVDNSDALGAIDVIEIVGIKQPTYTSATNPSVAYVRFVPSVLFGVSAT